jgi:hypothetical protein
MSNWESVNPMFESIPRLNGETESWNIILYYIIINGHGDHFCILYLVIMNGHGDHFSIFYLVIMNGHGDHFSILYLVIMNGHGDHFSILYLVNRTSTYFTWNIDNILNVLRSSSWQLWNIWVKYNHRYVPLVIIVIPPFLHSCIFSLTIINSVHAVYHQ